MGARVLIIEDNVSNLELMTYLLVAFGHSVSKAENGEAGLRAALAGEFDVLLCDIQLPDINGEEIARRLKASARTQRTPLVAVTALAMLGDRERLMAQGFDGYIAKPIQAETFVPQVESFARTGISAPKPAVRVQPQAPSPPPAEPAASHGTILVLDDSPDSRYFLRVVLEPEGFRVREATRVEEAISLCHTLRPNLVLADINLGRSERGEDFLQRIKAEDALKAIPVVLITSSSNPSPHDIARLKKAGALELLCRPFSPKDISDAVHSAVDGRTP